MRGPPEQMQELPPVYYLILNPCSDDFLDGIVFVVGMRRLGGIGLPKGVRGNALGTVELSRRTVILNFAIESGGILDAIRQSSTAKNFLSNNHQTSRP